VSEAPPALRSFAAENWFSCAETLRDAGAGLGVCTDCSESQRAAIHYGELINYIETYAAKYPLAAQEAEMDTLMADVMTRQADAAGAGEISRPEGRSVGGDEAILIIQNAAPQAIRIALTGAGSSTVENIPECADCPTYTGVGPATCPDSDETATLRVPAGSYSVIVNASGGGTVTPFIGTWDLEAGVEYFQCFFIVRS
jgi:hypothetical protein